MDQQKRRPRGAAVMAGLETVGDVLLLQLLFLLVSLPLFTMVPAAIALQRAFRKIVLQDRPGVTRAFFTEFTWAWPRLGVPGLLAPLAMGAATFSILFWLSTPGVLGTVALCIIIPLCGAGVAAYIALLGTAMDADDDTSRRGLLDGAARIFLTKPLALAGCVIAFATWLLLASRIPTLIPLGSGLVPALLAWLLMRREIATQDGISG
ncbi:DUF624 domain-containing protein [Paenarthrobacter sp. NPDC092416]|uniref:DUF624 domain-containing protein n=1 Tax=Paenarthrobacter sp. NPDC092416 TaxID=3364386 RepID=UPI0037FAE949